MDLFISDVFIHPMHGVESKAMGAARGGVGVCGIHGAVRHIGRHEITKGRGSPRVYAYLKAPVSRLELYWRLRMGAGMGAGMARRCSVPSGPE
jgi:hypothetical protein